MAKQEQKVVAHHGKNIVFDPNAPIHAKKLAEARLAVKEFSRLREQIESDVVEGETHKPQLTD